MIFLLSCYIFDIKKITQFYIFILVWHPATILCYPQIVVHYLVNPYASKRLANLITASPLGHGLKQSYLAGIMFLGIRTKLREKISTFFKLLLYQQLRTSLCLCWLPTVTAAGFLCINRFLYMDQLIMSELKLPNNYLSSIIRY